MIALCFRSTAACGKSIGNLGNETDIRQVKNAVISQAVSGHPTETSCNKIILIVFLSVWFNTREMRENAVAGTRGRALCLLESTPLLFLASCFQRNQYMLSLQNQVKWLLQKKGNPNVPNNCRKYKPERSSNKMYLIWFLLKWNGEKAALVCQKTHVHPHRCSNCKLLLNSLWNSLGTGWPPWKMKLLTCTHQDSGLGSLHRLLQVEGQVLKSRVTFDWRKFTWFRYHAQIPVWISNISPLFHAH